MGKAYRVELRYFAGEWISGAVDVVDCNFDGSTAEIESVGIVMRIDIEDEDVLDSVAAMNKFLCMEVDSEFKFLTFSREIQNALKKALWFTQVKKERIKESCND